MATLVQQSRVCKVGVSRVWDLVKNLTFKYLPAVQDCKKDSDDVGSTRTLHFKDKTAQTIKFVDISELDRRLGWDLISSTPSVSVLSTAYTLQLRTITETNWTLIELTTQFSTDATPAVIEDARFKQQDHLDAICKAFVSENERITYPETRRIPVNEVYHGHTVVDPYRWLEDPDSDATKAWVDEQNKITNEHLQEKCPLRHRLKHRLTELFNYERYGCPFKRGTRYFFFKNDGLQNQSVLYKQESLEGKAEVLLDPNVLEKDGTASLGVHSLSETGKYFAYGVSRSGSDWQTIFVKNVDTLKDFPEDKIEWVKFSGLSWTHDDKGFFYSRYPTPKNFTDKKDENFKRGTETDAVVNQTVWFHALGTPQSQDVKVFELPNEPKWMTSAEVSHDGRYVLLSIADSCDPVNRLFYFDLQACDLKKSESIKIVKLVDNFDAQYDYVTNEGPLFYFKTNLKAPKYKVICIDITKPDPKNWKEIIPQTQDVLQYVVNANGDWLIANYMQHVKEILKLFNLKGEESKYELKLPTIGSIQGMNARKSQSEVFYKFTSFLYPGTIFRFDLKTPGTAATVFRETRLKGFDPKPFTVEQVFYPSKDGTKIPMFLVYKKNLPRDGKQPVFLYGYGGFNISLEPAFDVRRLAFVQHLNGILAIPNLRGGGEYGEEWHKGGTLLNKQNVFDDFIAAAEYLVANKYTSPSKIAIHGGSNGGLLVAAVTNQRPDLFGCAVAAVGVLDMLRFHKFTIGYAWCSDYGCSDNKEQFEALIKYSPVHNVRKGKPFPAVLLTTADHDDRVVPLHSYKYIATLQHELGNEAKQVAPLLIRIETKAGHGAGKPITKVIEEQADMYGFVASHINATWFE